MTKAISKCHWKRSTKVLICTVNHEWTYAEFSFQLSKILLKHYISKYRTIWARGKICHLLVLKVSYCQLFSPPGSPFKEKHTIENTISFCLSKEYIIYILSVPYVIVDCAIWMKEYVNNSYALDKKVVPKHTMQ